MESLIRQTRSRFGGNKEDKSSSSTDRKIPPQKAQSFREKKRSQGWPKKQLSRQMSWEYDFSSTDYPTAVAAAAYAIKSLEESSSRDKKEREYGPNNSLSKTKSRVDDREEQPEPPLKSALKSLDGTPRTSFKDERRPTKKISFADLDEISNNKGERLPMEKTGERAPSLKRPPTSADKQFSMTDTRKPLRSPPPPPPPLPPPPPPPPRQPSIARKPGPADSAAAAWEKEEMISIKQRYEKLRATIDNWEAKKKNKAKRKIEGIEAEIDKRKAKAIKKYNSEIARITEIASGARSQAEENRRREELKVKDKANKIRATGKIPATCLCF